MKGGVQLVAFCSLTTRCHKILHTGAFQHAGEIPQLCGLMMIPTLVTLTQKFL